MFKNYGKKHKRVAAFNNFPMCYELLKDFLTLVKRFTFLKEPD